MERREPSRRKGLPSAAPAADAKLERSSGPFAMPAIRSPLVRLAAAAALLGAGLGAVGCGRGRAPGAPEGAARRVLFVGLDGGDWQLLDRYRAAGSMPELDRLAREGRTGGLETIEPPLSPLVWTTMMTGVSPLAHGILDFTRRNPASGALEPITRFERRVPAVWNLAGARGRSVAVLGLWATWPAEPVNGLLVSDRFFSFTSPTPAAGGGIVHPPSAEGWARAALAAAEARNGYAALHAELPWLSEEEYRRQAAAPDPYAHPVSALRRIRVETAAYHALATDWLARHPTDLAIVYFQGTDTLGHVFAPYAPPRKAGVGEADFARWSGVPERYFARIDRMLGDYRRIAAASGAVLMIGSDHGFLWGEGRPEGGSAAAAATAGRWHRDEGIYLLWGPGIAARPERARGRVDQVAATLLALLGLPPARGLAGPPLPGAPAAAGPAVDYGVKAGAEPARAGTVPGAAEEIARLEALGYLGNGGGRAAAPGGGTRTPASFNNEGLLRRRAGDAAGAARAFEAALALEPAQASALWNLSDLLESAGREPGEADDLLIRAAAAGLPDGIERTVARAAALAGQGDTARSTALLDRALAALPGNPALSLERGRRRMEAKRCAEAAADFAAAAKGAPGNALTHASLGLSLLCQGKVEAAGASLRRSLAIDPEQPAVRGALAQIGGGS